MWDGNKIQDWLLLRPHYTASTGASPTLQMSPKQGGNPLENEPVSGSTARAQSEKVATVEKLVRNPPAVLPIEDAIKMIREVLPSPMVERSWGFGPQRLCQELRSVVLNLQRRTERHG
jgi:hypothetical protein